MIDILRRGYERLEKFVESGLEYFKWLAVDRPTDHAALTDLAGIVQEAIDLTPDLHDSAVTLVSEIPRVPCFVHGESSDLLRVVRILIDNALKFSEEKKWVRIQVSVEADWVSLTVSDHGRGFAPEMGPELLRPFTIAHVMNHSQGTGLSLALASAIVTAYGGKLNATSNGVGQGAIFTAVFPAVSLL
jgi:signal transduction histidine kinase